MAGIIRSFPQLRALVAASHGVWKRDYTLVDHPHVRVREATIKALERRGLIFLTPHGFYMPTDIAIIALQAFLARAKARGEIENVNNAFLHLTESLSEETKRRLVKAYNRSYRELAS